MQLKKFSLTKVERYGGLNSHDVLKFIAISFMVIDHLGHYFFPDIKTLRLMGRISFPIFFFLIGYSKNYKIRNDIIIYAAIIIAGNFLINDPILPFNILATVIICRILMRLCEKRQWLTKRPFELLLVFAVWYVPTMIIFDYGALAIMFAICGYMAASNLPLKEKYTALLITFFLAWIVQATVIDYNYWQILTLFTIFSFMAFHMAEYKLAKFNTKSFAATIIMIIGRQSLIIYLVHLILFKIIHYFLFPEKHLELQIIKIA